jgi:hypothetical protein
MLSTFLRLNWVAVLLASLLAAGARAAAQAGTPTFFITNVDASAFPQVIFTLRAVNESNQTVAGLTNSITVYENGQPAVNVQVTEQDDAPVHYLFVVDQGRTSNYRFFGLNGIREIFNTLAEGGFFVDGRDTVQVMVRENINSDRTEVRVPATQSQAEFQNWVATYPFERQSTGNTRGLEGVGDALAGAAELVNPPGSATVAVIFLTRRIEDPVTRTAVQAAENLASDAKANHISVYTLHIEDNPTSRQPLEILAQGSNGQYVLLNRNSVPTLVRGVYETINAQRTYYTVTYTSALNTSDPRTITVNSPQQPAAGMAGSYQVELQPPTVNIEAPANDLTLTREPQNGLYPPLTLDVAANILWEDGFPRQAQSAELLINGKSRQTITPTGDRAEFTADLSDITAIGATPVTIEVRVTDSLGMESTANVNLTVQVVAVPTATPAATPTPEPAISGTTVGIISGLVCGGLGMLLVGLAAAAFVFLRRRASARAPVQSDSVEPQETVIVGRYKGPIALLTVLEGPPGWINEVVPLTKPATILGRNPKAADVTFYPSEESSISRVHCSIQQEAEGFKLMDRGSTSGTRLNGRPVQPNTPMTLADGDVIVLGDLSKRGVKLRFNLGVDPGQPQRAEEGEDRTRIVKPSKPAS